MSPEEKILEKYVHEFSKLMIRELSANSHKNKVVGDWADVPPKILLVDTTYHAAKLAVAIKENNLEGVREFAADVANMAMMVLHAFEKQAANGPIPTTHVAWGDDYPTVTGLY